MKVYQQKINGRVRAVLTINDETGMARIDTLDEQGRIVAYGTIGAGDGQVLQFVRQAEPRVGSPQR